MNKVTVTLKKEARVNRKQWIYTGIVVIFMSAIIMFLLLNRRSGGVTETVQTGQIANLAYCVDDQFKPCVVSFSTDANDDMFVNLLLPGASFPDFYLKVRRSGGESMYDCQRLADAVNNAQCIGKKLPPGEILHLMLISTGDELLLAEGDLSIIGLAFPTVGIAVITPSETSTMPAATPTETPLPLFVLPTFTETPQSYPNPSYP